MPTFIAYHVLYCIVSRRRSNGFFSIYISVKKTTKRGLLPAFIACHIVSVEEEDDDFVVSGWGDNEGIREDLLKDWGEVLEHWDGKDRARPSRVIKLCRKVSDYVRTCWRDKLQRGPCVENG